MYAKLVNNELQYAGILIKGHDETGDYCIAYPTVEQLIEKGYKPLVILPIPEYDKEEYRIISYYDETENEIRQVFVTEQLTDKEHNAIIQQEIVEEESKVTQRNIRNAALGDQFAINKLQEIEDNIQALRLKIRETQQEGEEVNGTNC